MASVRTFDVGEFDSIRLAGPHEVIVRTGAQAAVRAEGKDKALAQLDIVATDGTLRIGQAGYFSFLSHLRQQPATIYVDVPALRSASIAGSGDMRIDHVVGGDFRGSIAGSGDLQVESLDVENAKFSIAGSGNVRAAGKAKHAKASLAGSGNANLGELESQSAKVSIAGSGNVQACALETAKVSIAGSGNVRITGGARCSVHQAGSGQVQCD